MTKTNNRLVVVSFDAMGAEDIAEHLDLMPNVAQLIEQGTHVQKVTGIYPTLTYPSHTTIGTGVYPNRHGIINNTKVQPERGDAPDWYWYAKDIKVPTIFDLAHKAGLKSAAFLWPVQAKAPINWNIAEIFPNRIWTNQYLVSFSASSPYFAFDMNRRFGHLRNGIQQPNLDDFITAAAVDTLIKKQPDLTAIHLVDMDSHRHKYGVRSAEAYAALARLDHRLGELIEATKTAGTYAHTNFIVLGDHFQIDVHSMIHFNQLFEAKGWLTQDAKQHIAKDWRVMAKTTDGSTYVYVRDATLIAEVKAAISSLEGIEMVKSPAELEAWHVNEQATLMVEAQNGYYFTDELNRPAVVETVNRDDISEPDRYRAVHGFYPAKPDYQTTLVLAGPDVAHTIIPAAKLVDEAPTMAALLGLHFENQLDGHALTEALKTEDN
ncbi:alkaline phosphatase family protein [Periweissella cryptocerci]|uniref:Alkaline phosphatase family protein n=1 Tax=Periweissella cryptocerci TaxID=2506420 RepID=A0A4P6YW84_9LACO|nr:ectonucleotide pyrophosphatase/phosphodiesterase [Periweissella cryptocerci]QBO37112.1 alkaline phosphatase family protein [Periweissella cryptocerci]